VCENRTRFSEPVFEFRSGTIESRLICRVIWVWCSKIEHQTRKVCSKIVHGFRKITDLEAPSGLFQKACSKIAHAFQERVRKSSTLARRVFENLTASSVRVIEFLSRSDLLDKPCSKIEHLWEGKECTTSVIGVDSFFHKVFIRFSEGFQKVLSCQCYDAIIE
jgi:hypothetical protein